MGSPSEYLTRLRGALGKEANAWTDEGKKLIGDSGEFLTENLLDKLNVAWIKTVQHENVYSDVLRTCKVARPDYICRIGDGNFFLDSKHLSRSDVKGGVISFSIGNDEHSRLKNAQDYFGLSVIIVVWDRTDTEFTYCFSDLNIFSRTKTINGRSCLEGDFDAGEFCSLKFNI